MIPSEMRLGLALKLRVEGGCAEVVERLRYTGNYNAFVKVDESKSSGHARNEVE